jgi:hypothetical protein
MVCVCVSVGAWVRRGFTRLVRVMMVQIWLQDLDRLRQQLPPPVMALYPAPLTRVGLGLGTDTGLEVLCMDGVNGTRGTHTERERARL